MQWRSPNAQILKRMLQQRLEAASARSTNQGHLVGRSSWMKGMLALGEQPYPVTAEKVAKYATWAHGVKGLKANTVAGYVRGASLHSMLRYGSHWRSEAGRRVYEAQRVLRGCARIDARERRGKPQEIPLTQPTLTKLLASLQAGDYEDILFGALASMMYYAGARAAEATSKHVDEINLEAQDVELAPAVGRLTDVIVRQYTSKSRQAGPMIEIVLPRTNSSTCPVSRVAAYLRVRPQTARKSAFFCWENGKPYSYRRFLETLRVNLRRAGIPNPERYGTRSFRRGMATDAAELEVLPHQLKRLGRWKSEAYQVYIEQRTQDLRAIRRRLAAKRC